MRKEASKCQTPWGSSCTPRPPLFLNWSSEKPLVAFCLWTKPGIPASHHLQVSSIHPEIAVLIPTPQKIQILITMHIKYVCIHLLTLYLTVLRLRWKTNFYIGWILLNPQCRVCKITVLMHESSSVSPFYIKESKTIWILWLLRLTKL